MFEAFGRFLMISASYPNKTCGCQDQPQFQIQLGQDSLQSQFCPTPTHPPTLSKESIKMTK